MKSNYEKLIDHFIETDELGHYNKEDYSICLYDIKTEENIIRDLNRRIQNITTNYKLIVLDKSEKRSNINILDIDL